jgi:hypothetical protein
MPKIHRFIQIILAGGFLGLAQVVNAETKLEITPDTPAFTSHNLDFGVIRVSVDYQPFNFEETSENYNLTYTIYYNSIEKLKAATLAVYGGVSLQDLDANNIPEVIVSAYS